MVASVEIFECAIIAVGDFNPAIFSPDWLERNRLIGSEDAESARNEAGFMVSKQASRFATDWFVLQVLPDQFSITSKGALSPAFKDLAASTLSLVPHTPLTALGINFMAHYKMEHTDDHHRVGDILAPKDVWSTLFPRKDVAIGMTDVSIVIEQGKRGETPRSKDRKRITVQPSVRVKNGVFFAFNDHYDIAKPEDAGKTAIMRAVSIVDEHWQATWDESTKVFAGILEYSLRSK